MAATFATDGALNAWQGGNNSGAASTGIGTASNNSGVPPPGNFTSEPTTDFIAQHIGGGALATSASNTGNIVQEPVTITAGSGYTNGTYRVASNASGGQPAGAAVLQFVIAAGAIASAQVIQPGSGFTSAPTFTVANAININDGTGPGAGTLGALVVTVATGSRAVMLGAGFGTNKGTRRVTATGAVAIDAAVAPSTYLNRSGRALVTGDSLWAVAP